MRQLLAIFIFAVMATSCSEDPEPQQPDPEHRKSPIAIASTTHQPTDTYVKIVYGQPYKRGRTVFGDLEAYGEVWRTGANEATEITTTKPIQFNGNRIDAGTYAIFSIPRPNTWTIILNDSLGQWGAFEYDKQYDRLRTDVPSQSTNQVTEAFTIQFAEISGDSSSIVMQWDTTRVEIPITFIGATSAGSTQMQGNN